VEASRELVRLRDDLEGAAESLHQGGQDQVICQTKVKDDYELDQRVSLGYNNDYQAKFSDKETNPCRLVASI